MPKPMPQDWTRALVVAAHPDDIEYGVAAVVGVHEVEFLDHIDGRLVEGLELRRDLAAAIRRHRPELVVSMFGGDTWTPPGVTPAVWNSADHRSLSRAVRDAVADAGNEWIFPELAETPWSGVQHIAVQAIGEPAHAIDVTDGVQQAVASLTEHRRYLEVIDPETPVEEQARRQIDSATLTGDGGRQVGFSLFRG